MQIKIILAIIFMLSCFNFSGAQPPKSQWGQFGQVVAEAIGNSPQVNPKIAESDPGACFIAFEDYRSGAADIYLQKIDSSGKLLTGAKGVPICKLLGDQSNQNIISDGNGGAIIVWQDNRNGNFDIYAQRVDKDGKPLWNVNSVPVCEAPEGQYFPELCSDGGGGAIITWHDYRSGSEDIYAQRIDAAGNIPWAQGGVVVCNAQGTQWFPKLVSDGAFGAAIVWMDRRSGNFDVYAQRIDQFGKILFQADGVPICLADGNQENVEIISDGNLGAIIAWKDSRPNAQGIYFQKIDKYGASLLVKDGMLASSAAAGSSFCKIVPDKNGGAAIVWSDPHAGDMDVYLQLINKEGKILLGAEGKPVVSISGSQDNPKIFGDGPFFVMWEDKRKGKEQLFLQKINESGALLFDSRGILASDLGDSPLLGAGSAASGEFIYCYQDKKMGNFDIYAGNVSSSGAIDWINVVNNTPGAVVQQNFDLASTDGSAVFAFEDFRNGNPNIYLQKISKEGALLWGPGGIAAAPGPFNQKKPQVISDSNDGVIVIWEDSRAETKIYAQRINSNGQKAWNAGGIAVSPAAPSINQYKPKAVEDDYGGAIIVYCDYRGTLTYTDIYAQRINADGDILWGNQGLVVSAGNGEQKDPVISPKTFVAAWTDYRNGERNSDIFAQKLDRSGKVVWAEDGIPVCEAPDIQRDPRIVNDKEGGIIIAWTDRGSGNYDIFAQRVAIDGKTIFVKDGISVCQSARTQQGVYLTSTGKGETIAFWEDYSNGNWDINSQKITNLGQLVYPDAGRPVSNACGTQYAPCSIQIEDNTHISWEDYRGGKNYNVYMQKITKDGKPILGEDGFFIDETSLGGRAPQMISLPDKSMVLGWEDYRYNRHSIYAQRFTF